MLRGDLSGGCAHSAGQDRHRTHLAGSARRREAHSDTDDVGHVAIDSGHRLLEESACPAEVFGSRADRAEWNPALGEDNVAEVGYRDGDVAVAEVYADRKFR